MSECLILFQVKLFIIIFGKREYALKYVDHFNSEDFPLYTL